MNNQEAYEILKSHRDYVIGIDEDYLRHAINKALVLLGIHSCGYCDAISDSKLKNKYGDYGRVCDNCYENLS